MDITIVIPVYNSASTIIESVESVVRECTTNSYSWELILVDDGSLDNSVELINQYVDNSLFMENITVVCQPNGGAAVARNVGLRMAKGDFIAFNDSDDRWLNGKLKLQMDYLKKNTDVVMISGVFGHDNLSRLKKINNGTVIKIDDQVLKNYFSPPATIIRSSILKKSGFFYEEMCYAEEGYFFNNIVYFGKSVVVNQTVAEPISFKKRWGDSGLSGNLIKMEQGELFNIYSAYKFGYISFNRYLFAMIFSTIKFFRRWFISKIRIICK